jgi:hypothetical protein
MAIQDDFSVTLAGDIRHTSGTTIWTVLALHAWLQDMADNAAVSSDDNVSILSVNPSKLDGPRNAAIASRLNLLSTYNIDATAAQFINFGSVKQANGATLYSGLKTLGSIVAGSSIYVVQNGAKLTKFWPNGQVQIMVLAMTGSALIGDGTVNVFSRVWGQTYSFANTDISAGGENPAPVQTALDPNITLTSAAALALSTHVTLAVGASSHDLGNGNGAKAYAGTITLDGTISVAQAYQYLQAITQEGQTGLINGVAGEQYLTLNATYAQSPSAPFGTFAGGKFFVAQGWFLAGVAAADSQNYQLIASDGTTQAPPVTSSITVGNLISGDRVLVGRDNGSGGILTNEFTLNGAHASGVSAITVNETITTDHPQTGILRVESLPYAFSSWAGHVFTLSSPTTEAHASGANAFMPYIDKVTAATSEVVSFTYSADFTARAKVRQGSGSTPIVPFESTLAVSKGAASLNAVRTADV